MLSERAVSDENFSLENEIRNIELLKLKFGEKDLRLEKNVLIIFFKKRIVALKLRCASICAGP